MDMTGSTIHTDCILIALSFIYIYYRCRVQSVGVLVHLVVQSVIATHNQQRAVEYWRQHEQQSLSDYTLVTVRARGRQYKYHNSCATLPHLVH